MSVEEHDNPTPPADLAGGLDVVGTRLAAARREQKLEPGTVASRLHLSPEVVAALESGDRSALPAITFVRGYIKSYARLLGLDEDQILSLLPASESYRPAPLRAVGMRRARQPQPLGKWFVWVLGAGVLAMLLAYGVPMVERLLTRTPQSVPDNMLALPPDVEPYELEPLVADDGPAVLPDEGSVAEPEPEPEPEPDSGAGEETPGEAAPAPAEEAAAPPEAAPDAAAVGEPTGPAMITLRFSEDSWVEMESHGRKLVVGTQPAGSERRVRAEPPVQVLLGNAPGVELEYRGKPVDLESHRRGNVARLILED